MPWEHTALNRCRKGFQNVGRVEFKRAGDEKAGHSLSVGVREIDQIILFLSLGHGEGFGV